MIRISKISLTVILFSVILTDPAITLAQSKNFKRLCRWMEGSFDSREQHEKDSADYFDIRLKMTRIWPERTDGFWLYVEQAVAGSENKPYRQRVYQVMEIRRGEFVSVIHTLDDPLRFAGKPEAIVKITADSLRVKQGCDVVLSYQKGRFTGGTFGTGCPSDRKGARYTTSEVILTKGMLLSWDRGYDENGKQVWGAEKGGYRFIKN